MRTRPRLLDLSHVIREGMITLPGLPAPVITPHLTRADSRAHYAPGTEFRMDVVTLAGNTGTYIDSPFHRYEGGTDLAGLDLATLVGLPALVIDRGAARGIGPDDIRPVLEAAEEGAEGAAVLLRTVSDALFGTPAYAVDAPFLTGPGAEMLAAAGVALVGIDAINIDDMSSGGERPAHSVLLAAGIHVVEHLARLGGLPATGARFTAVPPAIAGFGTFPVRAFAELP